MTSLEEQGSYDEQTGSSASRHWWTGSVHTVIGVCMCVFKYCKADLYSPLTLRPHKQDGSHAYPEFV